MEYSLGHGRHTQKKPLEAEDQDMLVAEEAIFILECPVRISTKVGFPCDGYPVAETTSIAESSAVTSVVLLVFPARVVSYGKELSHLTNMLLSLQPDTFGMSIRVLLTGLGSGVARYSP